MVDRLALTPPALLALAPPADMPATSLFFHLYLHVPPLSFRILSSDRRLIDDVQCVRALRV